MQQVTLSIAVGNFVGVCAKYITYYLMDSRTRKVVATVVLSKHQAGGYSPRLEVVACRLGLEFLIESGIEIE